MTQGSSLPPLKKNDSKSFVIALLLLLAAGGLWFFLRSDEPEPEAVETAEPAPEVPQREQFAPAIEIPDEPVKPRDDAPSPERATRRDEERIPPSDWDCQGVLEPAEIRSVINGQPRKQVQTCYERGLKTNNLLQGTMNVLLTIGPDGTVRAVSIEGSLSDPEVYTCVRRVARTWKFPKPRGGCVRTQVPFQLTPKL